VSALGGAPEVTPRIAIVGDRDPAITAHRGVDASLALMKRDGRAPAWEWIHTSRLTGDPAELLAGFDGIWCVPGSPYSSTWGALAAIRFAREAPRVFLGTCGGFQHAMLEYAEGVWGVQHAEHAELDPEAADPVIAPLSCGLVEVQGDVVLIPGTRLARIYGAPEASEGYHCNYGLSPRYAERLASGPLRVAATDRAGELRAVELEGHPFYFATLFQPERAGLEGRRHPLIEAFVAAAGS
jgi:CTP synthase (UTP-ammonia lyase)